MMLNPPSNAGEDVPGEQTPCPECCSVWWVAVIVLDRELTPCGMIDKVKCVNCEYELDLEESVT